MTDNLDDDFRSAAKKLSQMAQLTAQHSKNWENFEEICESFLREAYGAGRESMEDSDDS